MILQYLDFERPIIDLENRLEQLRRLDDGTDKNLREEEGKLEKKIAKIRKEIFSNLTRWQITQLARHPNRPYMLDYVNLCFKNFLEIHGDRLFRDDPSIVAGFAELDSEKVMLIGQQKGRNTTEKIRRNFGMAHPEGYRKALRLMKLSEKFRLPVITVIDTPGAFPGIGAEERGQSEAIARNLLEMAKLNTPLVVVVIGEGGSGGGGGRTAITRPPPMRSGRPWSNRSRRFGPCPPGSFSTAGTRSSGRSVGSSGRGGGGGGGEGGG